MAQAKSLTDLMRIRAKNRDFLDSINGNLGTALGFKKPTGQEVTNEPAIIVFDDMSIIGHNVLRVGRTTGLRRGTVVAFGYEFRDEADATAYTDLLILGQNDIPFSTHGDSGSLIVTDDAEHRPIGLLWGGWQERLRSGHAQENWTYGIALTRVLETLDVDLATG